MQRKKISFGWKQLAETAETKRDPPPSNQRGGGRKKISEQLWVVPSFSPFFFSVFLFFPPHYPLSRSRPSSSFYRFRRRQTVANRIRGPLFTRSPATLCLLLTNFGRSFLAPRLSFSFISLTKSSYQRDPRSLRSSTFSWPRPDCSGHSKQFCTTDLGLGSSVIYRSLVLDFHYQRRR